MNIRSRHHNSQGFTLVEMLMVLMLVGFALAMGIPSMLGARRPLGEGVRNFSAQLSALRVKAISSNNAYRIRPKFPNTNQYQNSVANSFVVEYASNCSGGGGWRSASQLDLDLPTYIGVSSGLGWDICYDNRGIIANAPTSITLNDYDPKNQAKSATFEIVMAGSASIKTFDGTNGGGTRLSWDNDPVVSNRRLVF